MGFFFIRKKSLEKEELFTFYMHLLIVKEAHLIRYRTL
jgi:hypothetical protein